MVQEGSLVEAGAGDITDPVVQGTVIIYTPTVVTVLWNHKAWYTTGHIGREFGPLHRSYTRQEFNKLVNSHNYDEIRESTPRVARRLCPTCGHEM